jgi:hypothetical protein
MQHLFITNFAPLFANRKIVFVIRLLDKKEEGKRKKKGKKQQQTEDLPKTEMPYSELDLIWKAFFTDPSAFWHFQNHKVTSKLCPDRQKIIIPA